jgi:pantoate--beta-alanine ligase
LDIQALPVIFLAVQVIHDEIRLNQACRKKPVFIPTMGALHEGHLSLIRQGADSERPVVVSIFLNPTQFAAGEDLGTYPQTLETDTRLAREAGADILFLPEMPLIYPQGLEQATRDAAELVLPKVATAPGLEDACRPHFFGGVCLVVGRLLDLVQPACALFGEKDYQQFRVISDLVAGAPDRFGPIEILGCSTLRESNGLALSSRNVGIDPADLDRALGLSRALAATTDAENAESARAVMHEILKEHDLQIQYAEVRDAGSLEPVSSPGMPMRALIAVSMGSIRLIDNAPFESCTGHSVEE